MDLIDRYLAAIRLLLPRRQADDISAELRDVLCSQREDREAELGRPLTGAEEVELVKAFGHPIRVAARYSSRQYLIGPDFYPYWWAATKVTLTIVSAVLVTAVILQIIVAGGDTFGILGRAIGALWGMVLWIVGAMTILFVLLERYAPHVRLLDNWRPQDLMKIREKPQTRWNRISELTVQTVFILWWVGLIHFPYAPTGLYHGDRFTFGPAPIWGEIYWPVLGVTALRMLTQLLALVRPQWRLVLTAVTLAAAAATAALAAAIYQAGFWMTVTGTDHAAALRVELGINLGLRIAVGLIGVIAVISCLVDAWRAWRNRRA